MDKDIKIKIKAEDDASKTIGDIQRELKEANAELLRATKGTKEWNDAFKKVASLKDELKDLKDAIKTSASSLDAVQRSTQTFVGGLQAIEGAMALVGTESEELTKTLVKLQALSNIADGIKSFDDFGKTLNSLKATILSNPIFIISGVITAIGVVLYELRDKIAVVGKAFEWIGGIIGKVVDAVKDVADSVGLYNKKLEALESKKKQLETLNDKEIFQLEQQAKIQQALGKSTIDIEIKKIELLQQRIKSQIDNLELIAKERKLTDEEIKQLDELKKKYTETQTDMIIAEAKKQEEQTAARIKAREEAKKIAEEIEKAEIQKFEKSLETVEYYSREKLKLLKTTANSEFDLRRQEIQIQQETSQAKIDLINKEIERISKQKNVDKDRVDSLKKEVETLQNDLKVYQSELEKVNKEEVRSKNNENRQKLADKISELEFQKRIEETIMEDTIENKIKLEEKYYNARKQLILDTITDEKEKNTLLEQLTNDHNLKMISLNEEKYKKEEGEAKIYADKIKLEEEYYNSKRQFILDTVADEIQQKALLEKLEIEHLSKIKRLNDAKEKEDRANREKNNAEIIKNTYATLSAIDSLQNSFFTLAKQRAKGNKDELKRLEKAQFNIQKAAGIARAIMNTAEAITKINAQAGILGTVLSVATAIQNAAQIAIIASQQFPEEADNGGVSSSPPSIGGFGGGSGSITDTSQQPLQPLLPQGVSTSNLNEKDKQEIKAIVVETDIRSTQRRVNSIIESSSF